MKCSCAWLRWLLTEGKGLYARWTSCAPVRCGEGRGEEREGREGGMVCVCLCVCVRDKERVGV